MFILSSSVMILYSRLPLPNVPSRHTVTAFTPSGHDCNSLNIVFMVLEQFSCHIQQLGSKCNYTRTSTATVGCFFGCEAGFERFNCKLAPVGFSEVPLPKNRWFLAMKMLTL
eukprot:scpid108075/ scgid32060/ 